MSDPIQAPPAPPKPRGRPRKPQVPQQPTVVLTPEEKRTHGVGRLLAPGWSNGKRSQGEPCRIAASTRATIR